jgi:hypothetical protein
LPRVSRNTSKFSRLSANSNTTEPLVPELVVWITFQLSPISAQVRLLFTATDSTPDKAIVIMVNEQVNSDLNFIISRKRSKS